MDDDNKQTGRGPDGPAPDEAALAAFFEAARREAPEPPLALLSAILADAAATHAVPAAAPPDPNRTRIVKPARPGFWRRSAGTMPGVWGGASALAASALLGFWIGLAGSFSIDGTTLQAGTAAASADDPVLALLDLEE